MKSKQTMFFALFSDIESILKNIEDTYEIHYFKKNGLLDNKDFPHYTSILDIPDLGYTSSGDWNRIDCYLILPKGNSISVEEIPQRKGGVKYAVDQVLNPKSISLKLGGIYKEKENVLVAGRVSTISESDFSMEIYKSLSSKIKKEFKKIEDFYVGKGAEEKLRSGWRLVLDEGRRKEYDLSLK